MQVTRSKRNETLQVLADRTTVASRAGSVLLVELADRLGLTAGLSGAMAGSRERRSAHDPGHVVRDLAVMLADGGDCLSDLGAPRDPGPTTSRPGGLAGRTRRTTIPSRSAPTRA